MKKSIRVVGINVLIFGVYSTLIYSTLEYDKDGAFLTGMLRMTVPMLVQLAICSFVMISAFMDEQIPTVKAYLLSIFVVLLLGFSICSGSSEWMPLPTRNNKGVQDSTLSE